jgi:hypothetical protein
MRFDRSIDASHPSVVRTFECVLRAMGENTHSGVWTAWTMRRMDGSAARARVRDVCA